LTLHGTLNFMLTPTSEVEAQRVWIDSRETGTR
jgi:hypothetical protein